MDLITHETECKMFAYLREIGCCVSCSLRFVGTRNLEYFREPVSNAKKLKYITEDEEIQPEVACSACLGILQDVTQKIAIENIIESVKKAAHDEPTFNSALTLPICLFLRERSVQSALNDKFELSDAQQMNLKLRTQSVKEIWKFQVLSQVEGVIDKKVLSNPIPSPFLVEIFFTHDKDEAEMKCFSRSNVRKNQSSTFSRKTMENTLANMTREKFEEFYNVPPSKPDNFVKVEPVTCVRSSAFLGGRYAKLSRELSQTPWFINGEKKMETSVQDLICAPMITLTKADSVKFLSSGREDVDVRNIHSGRPFAVELVNPKVTIISADKLDEVVREINESTELVKITGKLKFLDASDLKKLKEGENEKTKVYRALCTFKGTCRESVNLKKLDDLKNLEITQKTPLRVLHRRPLVPRIRLIHSMRSRWLRSEEMRKLRERVVKNGSKDTSHIDDLFVLDVKTQAGTYVKEFVHGDFGRTRPNLGDILDGDFDIVALDVTGINLDWP